MESRNKYNIHHVIDQQFITDWQIKIKYLTVLTSLSWRRWMRCVLVALRWWRRSKKKRAVQVGESETGPSRQHRGVRPRIAVGPLDERLLRRRAARCVRPRITGEPRDERLLSRNAARRSGRLWRKGHVAVADETAPPHPRQRQRLVAPRVEHLASARSPRHERGGVSCGRARTDIVEVQDGAWERLPR